MTHAELVALLTEQAETLQYFCDSRDGVSPATAGEIATRLRTAADALAGETPTCPDCGKPMVCGGWCVNDPRE